MELENVMEFLKTTFWNNGVKDWVAALAVALAVLIFFMLCHPN